MCKLFENYLPQSLHRKQKYLKLLGVCEQMFWTVIQISTDFCNTYEPHMNYNSDVLICNIGIKNYITNVFVCSTHFFQMPFLVGFTTNHMGSKRSAAHFHIGFIFWLLRCWSSQLDIEKTEAYLSNVFVVGISQHFIVGNPWVGTCVGRSHWKRALGLGFSERNIFVKKQYLN